jgi:hypothetical protein
MHPMIQEEAAVSYGGTDQPGGEHLVADGELPGLVGGSAGEDGLDVGAAVAALGELEPVRLLDRDLVLLVRALLLAPALRRLGLRLRLRLRRRPDDDGGGPPRAPREQPHAAAAEGRRREQPRIAAASREAGGGGEQRRLVGAHLVSQRRHGYEQALRAQGICRRAR